LLEWSNGGETSTPGDDALLARVRGGDPAAFAWLYEEYVGVALSWARSYCADENTARDLVTESFARLLGALRRGAGPKCAFRLYLAATVRTVAYQRSLQDRLVLPAGDWGPFDGGGELVGRNLSQQCELARRAFCSLPPRWQFVLWRVDVEREPATGIAVDLGLSPAAVVTLTRRARDGLRGAHLRAQLHLNLPGAWIRQARRLAAVVRGLLVRWPTGWSRDWSRGERRGWPTGWSRGWFRARSSGARAGTLAGAASLSLAGALAAIAVLSLTTSSAPLPRHPVTLRPSTSVSHSLAPAGNAFEAGEAAGHPGPRATTAGTQPHAQADHEPGRNLGGKSPHATGPGRSKGKKNGQRHK